MSISHLAKILLCVVALSISTVSSASSHALPANISAVSVQNVATAIRMTGATLAVSVAIKQLLKGVDFVMDPENNQARSKEKVDYCSHGGTPCVNTPEEAVKYAMQSNFAVHWKYPFKGCKLDPRQGNGTIKCIFEKDGDIRTVAFFNFNTIVKSASYEEIAEQIIANAKNGDKDAIAYLQSVANQSKPKPATPTSPSKDEGKPDTKPANPPRKEPEKPKQCKPCQPYPIGTIGYQGPEVHKTGIDAGKYHYHIFTVNQNRQTCQCFWNYGKKSVWGHQYFGEISPAWINLNSSPKRPPNYPH